MMDQRQMEREKDSGMILKQKKRTAGHLPFQYIMLPPSHSIPTRYTGTRTDTQKGSY